MNVGSRRHARELALQVLFQLDYQPELAADAAIARFFGNFASGEADEAAARAEPDARTFAERLVRGVAGERDAVDRRIADASRNWRLERMARVDRNLLRLAVYELCYCRADVPAKVAINEAIEIAKRYGATETPAFVNGVLDRVLEDLGRGQ